MSNTTRGLLGMGTVVRSLTGPASRPWSSAAASATDETITAMTMRTSRDDRGRSCRTITRPPVVSGDVGVGAHARGPVLSLEKSNSDDGVTGGRAEARGWRVTRADG